jgi:hypothetical protein
MVPDSFGNNATSDRRKKRSLVVTVAGVAAAALLLMATIYSPAIQAMAQSASTTSKLTKADAAKTLPNGKNDACLTVVSDTSTFVDRGNTVNAATYSGWPTIPGATYIWSSNGLDTGSPYTFTKPFILPPGNTYSATITINADDAWKDLRINGNFVADESPSPSWASSSWPPQSWASAHKFTIPSTYFNPGLNTLSVKAVDIGGAYSGLAFKLEVFCKPTAPSTHWDKILFTLDAQGNTTTPTLKPLLGKTLDIKVRDNPAEVAILEDVVKGFLAAKYNLTKQDLRGITVKIIEVEYAIDTNTYGLKPETPQDLSCMLPAIPTC